MDKRIIQHILAVALLLSLLAGCDRNKGKEVYLEGLLNEMVSMEEGACYPAFPYTTGYVSGEIPLTNVLFDHRGPGVITRLQLLSEDKEGRLKFYFDGSETPGIELSSFEPLLPGVPEAFIAGNASYFPLPYEKSCRIVFEGGDRTGKGYQISFRSYLDKPKMETFSQKTVSSLKKKIAHTAQLLLEPGERKAEQLVEGEALLGPGDPVLVKLPPGTYGIYELKVQVTPLGGNYAQSMRDVAMQCIFDGLQTVRVPLSDFSGGGMGAWPVKNRYLEADGMGTITSRWLMPYKESASLAFLNEGLNKQRISYSIALSPVAWNERTLYFHASWKEETGAPEDSVYASIKGGRGIYKGDALTLFNNTGNSDWFTEGIVDVRVDNREALRASVKGLGNYYNLPFGKLAAFQTPFGGMARAGQGNSNGYNSLLRIHYLDGIPFSDSLTISTGGTPGKMDVARTVFWYGDNKARFEMATLYTFQSRLLPPPSASGE
ncbi:hypothetical protein FACS1894181_10810 [Bacteroidia bacterium]|nr:hypothetical protein FACS1894181_10810 [Bacteroidia bacterium]